MTTMRPIRETLPLDEALALVMEHARQIVRTERLGILEAAGRVLAVDVASTADVPPFDRAAMDGYAVVAEDTFGAGRYEPKILRVVEKVYTGSVPARAVARGECIEIATGAPMPDGADAVVMVEETEKAGERRRPRLHAGLSAAARRAGRGHRGAGQPLLAAGALLNPSRIGALAALGLTEVEVFARPRSPSCRPATRSSPRASRSAPGQIYDINQFTLAAIIGAHGGETPCRPDGARHDRPI
jgi:molybdopterin molybdotransferase